MSFYVLKRNGRRESVHFDKITSRVSKLCYGLDAKVRRKYREIASVKMFWQAKTLVSCDEFEGALGCVLPLTSQMWHLKSILARILSSLAMTMGFFPGAFLVPVGTTFFQVFIILLISFHFSFRFPLSMLTLSLSRKK